jgi:RNA polymerase sigma-70 factor (ECF subfamily)
MPHSHATFQDAVTSNQEQPPRWPRVADPPAGEIQRAAAGDTEAFRRLVERYERLVLGVAYTVLGDRHAAEDAAQEAFLRLHRALPRYRAEAAFGTWVFRLAVTAALDQRRRLARRAAAPLALPPLESLQATPEQRAEAAELLVAMAALSPALRAPVVLREVYGYEYAEIAELLGKPVGTVKAAVHRGRAALLEELQRRRAPGGEGV